MNQIKEYEAINKTHESKTAPCPAKAETQGLCYWAFRNMGEFNENSAKGCSNSIRKGIKTKGYSCKGWFYAPDGKMYRAVHGTLKNIHEAGKTLGFIPNRSHANWFIEIGDMVIMGCQVMYVLKTDNVNTDRVMDWTSEQSTEGIKEYQRPTGIYLTT